MTSISSPQDPISLEPLFSRYRQQLELLGFAPRTIVSRASCLRHLARFLAETGVSRLEAITPSTLLDFQCWFFYEPTARGSTRAAATGNRVLCAVRSFFRFLKEEGCLPYDPSEGLRYAREPERLPRNVLTPREARKVLEMPDTSTLLGYRDRTLLEVLYSTGIRKSELMNLAVSDANLEEELLRINGGKGAKDRVVPLSRLACSFLENYLKVIRPELLQGRSTEKLFLSRRGRPLGKNTLGTLVEKYARRAKLKKTASCHVWRHSCATHLLKNKANLRHVQEILGHRSLATTERYLHLTITDLKEAHRKFHPRERSQLRKFQS